MYFCFTIFPQYCIRRKISDGKTYIITKRKLIELKTESETTVDVIFCCLPGDVSKNVLLNYKSNKASNLYLIKHFFPSRFHGLKKENLGSTLLNLCRKEQVFQALSSAQSNNQTQGFAYLQCKIVCR